MFLRQLTLKGFKSFADATTLTLEPGVTVVVGPNGSGKSNVVDAIAWVLGAQAPSAVRSQKMDDVIFAGTARRPALGRAEVTLTIDNAAGLLPIEFTEVTVSRTLFRTGESEYAINGVPCRLLDVQELLSDSGVGRQQHVIVSQGQIDAVLNARPEDRRSIVEEAAGVLKFRKRKERAERRLEATEGNLLRVQDLLREVRRQLRPLQRQAEAAQRHEVLQAELRTLRVHLAGRELAGLAERLAALATGREQLAAGEAEVRAGLASLEDAVTAAEHRLAEAGAADVLDDLARAEQLRERARGLEAVLGERRRALARELEQLTDSGEAARLEADAAALAAEQAEVDRQLAELGPQEETLAADEAAFAAADPGDAEVAPAAPTGAASAASAAAEVRGELRTRRTSLERAGQELRRADERLAELAHRAVRLDEALGRERQAAEEAQTAEAPLVEELEAAQSTRTGADSRLALADAERAAALAESQTWTARADALFLALDQARARAGAERVAEAGEVLGTLLDLVEVDAGWEAAFEAAAGEALTSVVVHDLGTARRALGLLHDHDAAGAVLARGSSVPPTPVSPPVGEPVRAHVRSREPWVGAFLDALVGGVVMVDGGWSAALDAVLAHPGSVVVTRNGDRFGPSGWRVGAGSAGATGAALEEAIGRAESAAERLATADAELRAARADVEQARRVEAELARRLDATDGRFEAATAALGRIQAERRDLATQAETLTAARNELAERVEREAARVAELDGVLPELEAGEAAEAAAAREREASRAARRTAAAALANRRRDLAVRRAGLEERTRFLRRRIDDVAARRSAASRARTLADERADAVTQSLAALAPLVSALAVQREAVDAVHAELTGERRRQSEEARAVAGELDRLRRARHDGEQRLDSVRERRRAAELEEAELHVRRETAEDLARRELGVEPEEALAAPVPDLPPGATPKAHLEALERELRLLGPINPLALEEHTQLQERHTFLEAQLEDVRSTRRELVKVIRAVDEEIRTVFADAFADVAANFAELFGTLFPGGQGKLVLTVPDDLLNTGIEVEARPSGKNVKKLSLLSGGERSLTALAFLFAVFKARPSPFYVMDEVEAALDDVNLHRFLGLVDAFRQQAQLLIVSHQKRTMESADTLYGVSMQPGGSSKVVAERVRSAG